MMETQRIDFSLKEKRIRSLVIKNHMEIQGIKTALCFSCGNASRCLREAGVDIMDFSPSGDMTPNRWFRQDEIQRRFTGVFDATSGHLPLYLMTVIAWRLRENVTLREDVEYIIPSGSGETAVCLKMAYPDAHIIPEYDNADPATAYSPDAPLNPIVRAMFPVIHFKNYDKND